MAGIGHPLIKFTSKLTKDIDQKKLFLQSIPKKLFLPSKSMKLVLPSKLKKLCLPANATRFGILSKILPAPKGTQKLTYDDVHPSSAEWEGYKDQVNCDLCKRKLHVGGVLHAYGICLRLQPLCDRQKIKELSALFLYS